jgi:hypothetical protein
MKRELCSAGYGSQCPPDEIHVRVYFLQQGSTIVEAVEFFDHYTAKDWSTPEGHRFKNWKRLAWTWIFYR